MIAADTVVSVGEAILEKPEDLEAAKAMLRGLSGRKVKVFTGVCLAVAPPHSENVSYVNFFEETSLDFAVLSEEHIAAYVASGESFGKAGGFAIQGMGGQFVSRLEGCYFNVMVRMHSS